jgi:hypothetical protein
VHVEYAPFSDVLNTLDGTFFDEDLQYLDWCKLENFKWASILYKLRGSIDISGSFLDAYSVEAEKFDDKDE